MTYDTELSDKIPLNLVLDYLIDNEKPEVVLDFILKYEDDFCDIITYSINFMKMFQISFVKNLSSGYLYKVLRIMEMSAIVDKEPCVYLCWQIFVSNMSREKKDIFSKFLWKYGKSYSHPYKRSNRISGQKFDTNVWNLTDMEIGSYMNSMGYEDFKHLVTQGNTLLKYRIFQVGVVENLDYPHMFILLTATESHGSILIGNMYLQLLFSYVVDINVKLKVVEILKNRIWFTRYQNTNQDLYNFDDYASLTIWLNMYEDIDKREVLMYYLLNKKSIIKELGENCPEFLEEFFPIGDLWKYL